MHKGKCGVLQEHALQLLGMHPIIAGAGKTVRGRTDLAVGMLDWSHRHG